MGRTGRLALGAIAAAVASGQVAPSHLGASIALALASILLVAEVRPRLGVATLLPVALGAGLIAVRLAVVPAGPAMLDRPLDGDGPWELVVEASGSPRDGTQTATLATPAPAERPFRVAATLPRYPVIIPGDQVTVEGTIRPRPDSPYGAYLLRIGAAGTLSSRTLVVRPASDDPGRRLEELRRGAADALARVLPEPEAGLAAGILIGLRDLVDRDLAAAFTTAGVSHVVAISGWNIAIVAAGIAAMTGRLGRRRRSVVTLLAIAAYVAFSGASASVVRAALMAGVVLLARETGRAGRAAAALGWAATILLVSDPGLIGDAGFQLSSLATAGLIAWATPLSEWLERHGRGRMPRWLAESLGVSLAAQAATLPIVLVSFGRLAILSPVVNLLVVPLVAPAMAAGVAALAGGALVLAGLPPAMGAVLAAPGWVILRLVDGIVTTAAGLPFASVTLAPPLDLVAAAITAVGLVGLTLWRRPSATRGAAGEAKQAARAPEPGDTTGGPRLTVGRGPTGGRPTGARGRPARAAGRTTGRTARRAATVALIVAVCVTGGVLAARPPGIARVSILDVGQGDAILVEGSRGGRLLVDGGPDPDRLLVVLDARIPPWDRRIDAVILTHPHEDHVAGLALLLARYRVGRVFEPGMIGPGPGYAAWQRTLSVVGAATRGLLAAGDRLSVDEIALRVLWPIRGQVPATPPDGGTGINNVSIVLLGQVGERRFLLMGDVEEGIDPSLLKDRLPRVDLLKVAHHGSKTATTQAFVDATRPTVAVASAGAGNPYGHPAKSTLDRLAATGARVFRTDLDGSVVVGFEAGAMTVRAEGGRPAAAEPVPSRVAAAGSAAVGAVPVVASTTFLCAIPVTALVPPPRPPAPPVVRPGRSLTVGYHRTDDRAWTGGGRLPPALPGSPALVRAALARRGRGRRVAGGADTGPRDPRGPGAGRGRRAAARRRQGTGQRRPGARPPPRRWLGRLADAGRPPGAGSGGREPPGHPARRRRSVPALGGLRDTRGTDRRLRRQAGQPAAGIARCPVRPMAAPASGAGDRRSPHGLGRHHLPGDPRSRRASRSGRLPCGGRGAR
jgi:competence protein ComEC